MEISPFHVYLGFYMSGLIRTRRNFLTLGGMGLLLAGCGRGAIQGNIEDTLYTLSDPLNRTFEQLIFSPQRLAPEFRADEVAPEALLINTAEDNTPEIDFDQYRLTVKGLVKNPLNLSLKDIRALPYKSTTIRHICVEGWAAITQWGGVPLVEVLKKAQPTSDARYVFFRSAQGFVNDQGQSYGYYETWDMASSIHPQTLLAYEKNKKPLPLDNGAPIRLSSPIKLGYKQIKWVTEIMLVATIPTQAGYWVDLGYEWYGGV
jgi:DMSO/TMAO reductase YedYZ molybdopterin-dependent catalytic subunit